MAKKSKVYSGRSGYSALDNKYTLPPQPGKGKAASIGEKTTVRSGAKSSKTYLTTSPTLAGQTYLASPSERKRGKSKSK